MEGTAIRKEDDDLIPVVALLGLRGFQNAVGSQECQVIVGTRGRIILRNIAVNFCMDIRKVRIRIPGILSLKRNDRMFAFLRSGIIKSACSLLYGIIVSNGICRADHCIIIVVKAHEGQAILVGRSVRIVRQQIVDHIMKRVVHNLHAGLGVNHIIHTAGHIQHNHDIHGFSAGDSIHLQRNLAYGGGGKVHRRGILINLDRALIRIGRIIFVGSAGAAGIGVIADNPAEGHGIALRVGPCYGHRNAGIAGIAGKGYQPIGGYAGHLRVGGAPGDHRIIDAGIAGRELVYCRTCDRVPALQHIGNHLAAPQNVGFGLSRCIVYCDGDRIGQRPGYAALHIGQGQRNRRRSVLQEVDCRGGCGAVGKADYAWVRACPGVGFDFTDVLYRRLEYGGGGLVIAC